jgi:hypothetical protein
MHHYFQTLDVGDVFKWHGTTYVKVTAALARIVYPDVNMGDAVGFLPYENVLAIGYVC